MPAKKLRIYLDTSVIGGCMDAEFAEASERLLHLARSGKAIFIVSDLMIGELRRAPAHVQRVLDVLPRTAVEPVEESEESIALRDAYLAARVVGRTHANDAHHVALATVANVDMIVSWNFKDIVHFEKIKGFNTVNAAQGYGPIRIFSPLEVV
jgi:predicted nucleic acid-binding protein